MGLFRKTPEEQEAITALRAADAALHATQRREEEEGIEPATSAEYQRLNQAANDAASRVSWWRGGTKRGRS